MTLETIKAPDTAPTEDIDHLINHVAVIVRATRDEYGLTAEQKTVCYDRFSKIHAAHPAIAGRVIAAATADDYFWKPHSDTVLKYLHDTGILIDTLGI